MCSLRLLLIGEIIKCFCLKPRGKLVILLLGDTKSCHNISSKCLLCVVHGDWQGQLQTLPVRSPPFLAAHRDMFLNLVMKIPFLPFPPKQRIRGTSSAKPKSTFVPRLINCIPYKWRSILSERKQIKNSYQEYSSLNNYTKRFVSKWNR